MLTIENIFNSVERIFKEKKDVNSLRELRDIRNDYCKLLLPAVTDKPVTTEILLMKKFKLTALQAKFVMEYSVDMNAYEAIMRANGKDNINSAKVQGNMYLATPKIAQAIQFVMSEKAERTQVKSDWVILKLKTIVERCMQVEQVYDRDGKPTGRFDFDPSNASKALELLGRHIGMWDDRLQVTGEIGVNVTVEQRVSKIEAERKDAYKNYLETLGKRLNVDNPNGEAGFN